MSQENVEIVRSLQPSRVDLVEVFERGRFEQVSALADPRGRFDASFESSFIAGKSAGSTTLSYRGIQGFVEGWREWLAAWRNEGTAPQIACSVASAFGASSEPG